MDIGTPKSGNIGPLLLTYMYMPDAITCIDPIEGVISDLMRKDDINDYLCTKIAKGVYIRDSTGRMPVIFGHNSDVDCLKIGQRISIRNASIIRIGTGICIYCRTFTIIASHNDEYESKGISYIYNKNNNLDNGNLKCKNKFNNNMSKDDLKSTAAKGTAKFVNKDILHSVTNISLYGGVLPLYTTSSNTSRSIPYLDISPFSDSSDGYLVDGLNRNIVTISPDNNVYPNINISADINNCDIRIPQNTDNRIIDSDENCNSETNKKSEFPKTPGNVEDDIYIYNELNIDEVLDSLDIIF